MGMPDVVRHWTREEVLALPEDGTRYELVDGELLVSPSPRFPHQRAVRELTFLVGPYVEAHGVGEVIFSPSDLDLRSGHLVQPDLFVVDRATLRGAGDWSDVGIPRLVIEVLSPSTARYDRITKRRLYQRVGVPVYWVVDLDARLVEMWRPEEAAPGIVDGTLTWQPEPGVPPLRIDLPAFFRGILDRS